MMKINFAIVLLTLLSDALFAQNKFTGTWTGELRTMDTIRVLLHVFQSADGTYTATMDNPDQNAFGIKCDKVEAIDSGQTGTLNFSIDKIKVSYTGKIVNDSTLTGTFTQGASLPLSFHKNYVAAVV